MFAWGVQYEAIDFVILCFLNKYPLILMFFLLDCAS